RGGQLVPGASATWRGRLMGAAGRPETSRRDFDRHNRDRAWRPEPITPRTRIPISEVLMTVRRLTRSKTQGKIAGVCAGIADYLEVDVVLIRAAWVVLSIVPGAV